ncbi:MAG: response regulator, partial [Bacteroidales bacterium]|nr:response regulator [Bacteroidales bacterium]
MRIIIIDDEPLARELVRKYLSDLPGVEIVGECENGFDALKAIQELKPDLLFLDIQMPKIDGFELLEVLDHRPEIIFTTAFDQYAIRAFEMNAVDYLLKPFSKVRLSQAIDRARQRTAQKEPVQQQAIEALRAGLDGATEEIDRVVARLGSRIIVMPIDKIWYIEAQDDYVMVYSELGNYLKEKTMKYFETHLASKG